MKLINKVIILYTPPSVFIRAHIPKATNSVVSLLRCTMHRAVVLLRKPDVGPLTTLLPAE